MHDITLDQPPRILGRQRHAGPNAFALQRLVPTLQLAVGLRIVRRRSHVRHARDANEFLEVLGDKLRPVVGDDPRLGLRIFLLGGLENDLDIDFPHRLAQVPLHDRTAVAVQHAA